MDSFSVEINDQSSVHCLNQTATEQVGEPLSEYLMVQSDCLYVYMCFLFYFPSMLHSNVPLLHNCKALSTVKIFMG